MGTVGHSLAFFFAPLGAFLLVLIFRGQAGESFAHLLLNVFFIDFGVNRTFVAFAVSATSAVIAATVAAAVVVTAAVSATVVATSAVVATGVLTALGCFLDVYLATDTTTLLAVAALR